MPQRMGKVLIVGAGAVGGVVAHKCALDRDTFGEILLASRTLARCERLRTEIHALHGRDVQVAQLDADDVERTVHLLRDFRPDVLINVALPYQDLPLMDACLAAGVHYIDTANYEPPDVAKFEYRWQWAYRERFEQAGLMAVLGAGFDPGVTNAYCAYAQRHLFTEIDTIDIVDCNAGDHGKPFATNFNPEVNLREITQRGRYFQDGAWIETEPMAVSMNVDFPEIGERKAYLLYHEELESLAQNLPGLRRIRFWMTFGDRYLTYLRVLESVGLTRIDPIDFEGRPIVPLKFLKALLPDPASLAPGYRGRTCIGCVIEGRKDGQPRRVFIYNVCDHASCYAEVRSQAVSYTAGVPPVAAAVMLLTGRWRGRGVFNVEELDPVPFLEEVGRIGLPWHVKEG